MEKGTEYPGAYRSLLWCDGPPWNLPLPLLGEGFQQEQSTTTTSPRAYLEVIIWVCHVENNFVEIPKYSLAREK